MSVSEALPSVGSLVAGFLFGIAWLVWIDGVAFAAHEGYGVNGVHWLPGILQTLALFMVNVINWSALTEDAFMDEGRGAKVKCWIFTSFVFAFSGLIGAIWILVAESNAPLAEGEAWNPAVGPATHGDLLARLASSRAAAVDLRAASRFIQCVGVTAGWPINSAAT